MSPFKPLGDTVNINVSSSSQSVTVDADGGSDCVRVFNNGTATVWVAFSSSLTGTPASLTTSIPIGPGVTEVYGVCIATAAAIAAASTGKIYFTPGTGI